MVRLDLFMLCSHSDLCAIINKELLIQYSVYYFKVYSGFSDLIRLDLNLLDSKNNLVKWPENCIPP